MTCFSIFVRSWVDTVQTQWRCRATFSTSLRTGVRSKAETAIGVTATEKPAGGAQPKAEPEGGMTSIVEPEGRERHPPQSKSGSVSSVK